ncbi:YopX family protein [Bacillus pumilus]|uniref:YopX family protein n=1 Tax=Bacillus pumilus TaxID=1408 RepID=UPI002812A80F|nr:YopX family protein [Bacillus pumilus]MDR0123108.1 YopX family protein [Bacillus pumilus]
MDIFIRYILKHRASGNIEIKEYSTSQLEAWGAKKLSPCFDETEYELIARNLFTGLKDSEGNEIYGGDVILITYDEAFSEHPYYIGEVKFRADDNYPAFDLLPWIDCEMNALSWLKSESDPSVKSYEVIGNIYQNPNLLKEAH